MSQPIFLALNSDGPARLILYQALAYLAAAANVRFWRKAATGPAVTEWPVLTQSGRSGCYSTTRQSRSQRWSFTFRSLLSDKFRQFGFWCKHPAGIRKSKGSG